MRILIFGANGMLGHKLVRVLGAKFDVWATVRSDFSTVERFNIFDRERTMASVDVTDFGSVRRAIQTAKPDVVINSAGIIKQIPESNDAVRTLRVNSVFPQFLSSLAGEVGFRLISISTDCVFSGDKGNYSESDVPDARDLYGISKLLGEVASSNCLTIRTSIIGRELTVGHSLVEWFLAHREKTVKGYVNAVYSGFPTVIFAEILSQVITDHPALHGVYHVSSEPISKFELLNILNSCFQAHVNVEPYEDFIIDRSLDSSRFKRATGFSSMSWEQMIEQMAADLTPYDKWKN